MNEFFRERERERELTGPKRQDIGSNENIDGKPVKNPSVCLASLVDKGAVDRISSRLLTAVE